MTNTATFVSQYTPCDSCRRALLVAALDRIHAGFGELYLFADGHVVSGIAMEMGNSSPLEALDDYLSRAVTFGLCHDLSILVWHGEQAGVISAGKDHLGPFVPLTARWDNAVTS